jgi:hypothetical protein
MGFFTREKPQILKEKIEDPLKQSVANPMSGYLSKRIGQGLPTYQGDLYAPMPTGTEENLNRYLALDPTEFFETRIKAPAMETFKEDLLPVVREQFAGNLSGSGRFRTESEEIRKFSTDLAGVHAGIEMELPQKQLAASLSYKEARDRDYAMTYDAWMKTLPDLNPILQSAMAFLQDSTGTGTDWVTALDPGQEGWFLRLVSSIFSGNTPAAGGSTTTATAGGSAGNVTSGAGGVGGYGGANIGMAAA